MGEIHQYGPGARAGLAHRLAAGAEGPLEVGRDRHLQLPQTQLQAHIQALLAGGGVDGRHQGRVRCGQHGLDHLGAHAA